MPDKRESISPGLPSASFHGINIITAVAKALPDHRSNVVRLAAFAT